MSQLFEKLKLEGHLCPLEPRPPPSPLPKGYKSHEFCKYHQELGHQIDKCINLRHAIQNLIDKQVNYFAIIGQPSRLCLNFILQAFRLVRWFYCLFSICFLVGCLLNKIYVVFDAFDSSCCSYVHKNFKKQPKKNFKKKKKFWTRGIRPSSHFNSLD